MIRFLAFLLAVSAAAYGGYRLAPTPVYTPALVTITACTPNVVVGYVLVKPEEAPKVYIGGIHALSADDKGTVNALRGAGKLDTGLLHFKGPALCGTL